MANDATSAQPRQPLMTRQKYGEELRIRREAAGHTQQSLGDAVIMSPSMIAHIEAGRRRPRLEDAQRLDKELGVSGFFERWLPTLEAAQFADHFKDVAESERNAEVIEEYACSIMPGLLQTSGYARAVFRATDPLLSDDELDKQVVNRISRSHILGEPKSPRFWVILSENVLRTAVGGPAVMAEQLRHVAALVRSNRVQVQVVPHSAGAHATMSNMIKLMRLPDGPDEVYVEALFIGAHIDDPVVVRRYRDVYDLARAAALPLEASLQLIESVAEEYEHAQQEHS